MNAKHLAVACLLLLLPEALLAHSPIPGFGNFLQWHVAPGFGAGSSAPVGGSWDFFGQQGSRVIQPALGVFAFFAIAGFTAAWFSVVNEIDSAFIIVLSATIGLLIALAPKVALPWCGVIALLAGFLLGIDSAQEELVGRDKLVSLLGSAAAIYLLVIYPMALAEYANKKAWLKIGIRILGSWIAASSLLVLALLFSPHAQA